MQPLSRKPHDLFVRRRPPTSPTKPSVPLAEEFELDSLLSISHLMIGREQGWENPPEIETLPGMGLHIRGNALSKVYPQERLTLDTQIIIPRLRDSFSSIRREDHLSLIVFAADVGLEHDSSIAVQFRYRERNTTNILTTPTAIENSRRFRAFFCLALAPSPITQGMFLEQLSLEENGDRRIAIVNNSDRGFDLSPDFTCWIIDSNFVPSQAYTVVQDTIEIIPICTITRLQNFQENGVLQGYNGEDDLSAANIQVVGRNPNPQELDILVKRRLIHEISRGFGPTANSKRIVLNLSAGAAIANPGKPGVPAASPNNSFCQGNDQRVAFTNQGGFQDFFAELTVASNDGGGRGRIAIGLNTNAPIGSYFSPNRSAHRIFDMDGVEQSLLGTFSNLGGSGSLQWVAGENSTIRPGSQAFIVPSIYYPPGSGFSVPILNAVQAWNGSQVISGANIRHGLDEEIIAFEVPQNEESFILVYDTARAALLYIYKLINVNSNANGTVVIPSSERGCFAFIEGVPGRINAPCYQGLASERIYRALVYYPPRSQEVWQIEFDFAPYQGRGFIEAEFLNGAQIVSSPLHILHSLGGGLSVHAIDSALRNSAVAMHLPSSNPIVKSYSMDTPIFFPGENYPGPITFREDAPALRCPNHAFPTPGQIISTQTLSTNYSRSLNRELMVDGDTLGYRVTPLATKRPFQSVMAFLVHKDGETKLLVITRNCHGRDVEDIPFNPDMETGIDLFSI